MPMQEDDDVYIQNLNSDNETDSIVGIIADHNSDDESTNKTLNDDSSTILMMRKRESIMILMNDLKNKWISMTINQKSPLVKNLTCSVLGQHHQQ